MSVRALAACIAVILGALAAAVFGSLPRDAAPVGTPAASPTSAEVSESTSFAVIGDVPAGAAQVAALPGWVDRINASRPALTFHVGDIKDGKTRCDDAYYRMVRAQFDRFTKPLVYTPGDNEWTDCHEADQGAYDPLERLASVRSVFFDRPGVSLGQQPVALISQAAAGFPENVQLRWQGLSIAVVHVVGSDDGLRPWPGQLTPTPAQVAEEHARMANAVAVLRDTFTQARQRRDRAVMLFLQADMFAGTPKAGTDLSTFRPLVQALVEGASTFPGPVYVVNGDSHTFVRDFPLVAGSPWLTAYQVTGAAGNVERVTVEGAQNSTGWLQGTVNTYPGAASLVSWERVPYAAPG